MRKATHASIVFISLISPPLATTAWAANSASFVNTDTSTMGNWVGRYGADGYNVSQDSSIKNPSYAQVVLGGQNNWTWASSPSSPAALQRPENQSARIAGTWFAGGSFTVDVNITDSNSHKVALYALDWDSNARAETIRVLDASTGAVLDSRALSAGSFHNGTYLIWNVSGHVKFEIIKNAGANAVISGLFFGGAPIQGGNTGDGVSLAAYGGDWNAAMKAAPTKGNKINVPAGTWPSPQIRPYAGLTIQGAGSGATFITRNASGTHNDGGVFKVTTANVTITDLTVRGYPKSSGLSDDILINGIEAPNLKVQRVNLENAQGIGVQTEGPNGNMSGCLFEDVRITNTMLRYNGAHGVALWPYKGTKNCTYRRIYIKGAVATGIAIDAGTTDLFRNTSVDNNTFEDVTIINGQTDPGQGWIGAVLITGGNNNHFTNTTITDLAIGPAFNIGFDQSGLGATGNVFTNTTLARLTDGLLVAFDTCGNTFNGGNGSGWKASDPSHCNTFLNWSGLTLK